MALLKKVVLLGVLAFGLQAPGAVAAQQSIRVDESFSDYSLKAFNRTRPYMVAKWVTRPINGEIHICGVVAFPEWERRNIIRTRMRRGTITYNNKVIMTNLIFFKELRRENQLLGAQAPCRSTGQKAPAGPYTVFIDI